MRVQLLTALLLLSVTFSQSELLDSSVRRQIQKLKIQTDILHDLLEADECPTEVTRREEKSTTDLEVLKLHYDKLLEELIQCRANKEAAAKSAQDKMTTTQMDTTTTEQPTTTQKVIIPVDCQQLHDNGITTPGIYTLQPMGYKNSFEAWCDFDAAHGWTVIQRRQDSTDFYLYWADYKTGFGQLNGSYWLGNDNIHALTRTNQKLNIFMRRYDGVEASANYTTFIVNDETDKYKLTISGYSGNASHDSLSIHNNMYFSTRDRDNDRHSSIDCAETYNKGAWWYNNCHHSNLNGIYCASSGTVSQTCAVWSGSFGGGNKSLTKIVMRVTRD